MVSGTSQVADEVAVSPVMRKGNRKLGGASNRRGRMLGKLRVAT